jgi:hypothetical protein
VKPAGRFASAVAPRAPAEKSRIRKSSAFSTPCQYFAAQNFFSNSSLEIIWKFFSDPLGLPDSI